jgi:chemotaxis protein methyltransferase CheR
VGVLRRELVPRLRTYPSLRVWHAGSPAVDVYATAIVLREEGLLTRTRIYATADSDEAVDELRRGDAAGPLEAAAAGYHEAGGAAALDEYYQPAEGAGGALHIRPLLRERLVFAVHSLATDASFNEFHLIVARDLAAGGDPALHARAEAVLRDSLCPLGFLLLGTGPAVPGAGAWLELLRPEIGLYRRVT